MTEKTFEKYKLVIDEWFVNGFDGAKAYRKYYPKAKRADDSFYKIQRIPEVEDYIKSKREEAKMLSRSSHKSLLDEYENWMYSDITQTISLTPDQLKTLPPEVRRLITKFKRTTRTIGDFVEEDVIELQFVSKEKAADMLNRHIGFYEKDNKQKENVVNVINLGGGVDPNADETTD